jgi:hypothetical protein
VLDSIRVPALFNTNSALTVEGRWERCNVTTNRAVSAQEKSKSRGLSSHELFIWAAVVITLCVFFGFSRTYYFHRWFGMPDLRLFIHIHGVAMTSWIALFLIQTLLISTRRVQLHRKLGLLGIVSAVLVVTFGVSATVLAARREVAAHTQGVPIVITVLALELTQMLMFGGFVFAGMWLRNRPDHHKRLMVLATLCMVPNALVRLTFWWPSFTLPLVLWTLLIVSIVVADLAIHRKLHPVFAKWAAFQICLLWLAYFVGESTPWQSWARRALA